MPMDMLVSTMMMARMIMTACHGVTNHLAPWNRLCRSLQLDNKNYFQLAYCAINPFPEYKSGGNFDDVQKAQRAAAAAEREKIPVPFKAVSTPKTLYQIIAKPQQDICYPNAESQSLYEKSSKT